MPLNTVPELARAASARLDLMEDRLGVLEAVPQGSGPLRVYTVDDQHRINWILVKRADANEYAVVARPASNDPDSSWVPDGYQVASPLLTSRNGDNAFNLSASDNLARGIGNLSGSYSVTDVHRFFVPPDLEIHVSKGFTYLFGGMTGLMDISDMGRVKVVNDNNEVSLDYFSSNSGVSVGRWIEDCDYKVTTMQSAKINARLYHLRNLDFSECTNYTNAFNAIANLNMRSSSLTKIFEGTEPMDVGYMLDNNVFAHLQCDANDPFTNYSDGSIPVARAIELFRTKFVSTKTLKKFNFDNLTSAARMFNDAQVGGSDDVDVLVNPNGKLTSVSGICDSIRTPSFIAHLFHAGIDTSTVTDFSYAFNNLGFDAVPELNAALKNISTDSATSLSYMLSKNNAINQVSALSNWNVSNVTSMSYLFGNCTYLAQIYGLENWDVSRVTSVAYMFVNCRNLNTSTLSYLESWGQKLPANCSGINTMFFNVPNSVTRPSWYAERASADPANPDGPNYDPVFDASRPEYDPNAVWDGPDVFTIR